MASLFFNNTKSKLCRSEIFTVFGEWGRPDMLVYQYLQSIFNKKKNFLSKQFWKSHERFYLYKRCM